MQLKIKLFGHNKKESDKCKTRTLSLRVSMTA